MSIRQIEEAERLVAANASSPIVAYQIGRAFPGFLGVTRSALAAIMEQHGFDRPAENLRGITAEQALAAQTSAGKIGSHRRDRLMVRRLQAEAGHARAWGVYRVDPHPDEHAADFGLGARVWVAGEEIGFGPPPNGAEIPACMELARQIVDDARRALVVADATDAGRAIDSCVREAGALPFIARGVVVAPADFPGTARLVALHRDIRSQCYDEETRTGLRAAVVAVTSADTDAVSDAILDDLETRLADAAGKLREEAGSGSVRASTLQRRRGEIAALAQMAQDRAAWLGARAERFAAPLAALRGAYASAVDAALMEFPEELRALADRAAADAESPSAPEASPPSEPPAPAPVPPPPVPEPVQAPAETIGDLMKLFS